MTRGMTGYSRVTCDLGGFPLTISIRAVNRRSYDLTCHLPPSFAPFETKIRSWVSQQIERGSVSLTLHWSKPPKLTPNLPMIKELKEASRVITEETSLSFTDAFALVIRGRDAELFSYGEVEIDEAILKKEVEEALDRLVVMRIEEGKMITSDLLARCQKIKKYSKAIATRVEGTSDRIRQKLIERLKGWEIEDERLIKEVALYAERADATEEKVRFDHHLKSLIERIEGSEKSQGKICEFIVQEMVREINTLGAKIQDSQAGQEVVEIKGELEKIREQLQNVE